MLQQALDRITADQQEQDALFSKFKLSPQERVVAAAYLRNGSYRDIAQQTGHKENYIGVVLSQIRRKLPREHFPYRVAAFDERAKRAAEMREAARSAARAPGQQLERKCLGCGKTFKSPHPPKTNRLCDPCGKRVSGNASAFA